MTSRMSVLGACLGFLLMLGACMPGVVPPRGLEAEQVPLFPGIADHLAYATSRAEPLNVVLVHGMSHGEAGSVFVPSNSADAARITRALGGSSHDVRRLDERRYCGVVVTSYAADVPGGKLQFYEINYTSYLLGNTEQLDLPAGCAHPDGLSEGKLRLYDEDQALLVHAASMSSGIKTGVVTWGLSDAAVYLHEPTRTELIRNVSQALQDIGDVTTNKPVVFIAKSLGSRVLFDALNHMYDELAAVDAFDLHGEALPEVPPDLTNTHTVYFLANQLPLLELGAPLSQAALRRISVVLNQTFSDGDDSAEAAAAATVCPHAPALYFVAFSDPNDLLTFRITPTINRLNAAIKAPAEDVEITRVVEFKPVDVVAGVAPVFLGLVAHPGSAHSGHLLSPGVLELMTGRRLEAGACPP